MGSASSSIAPCCVLGYRAWTAFAASRVARRYWALARCDACTARAVSPAPRARRLGSQRNRWSSPSRRKLPSAGASQPCSHRSPAIGPDRSSSPQPASRSEMLRNEPRLLSSGPLECGGTVASAPSVPRAWSSVREAQALPVSARSARRQRPTTPGPHASLPAQCPTSGVPSGTGCPHVPVRDVLVVLCSRARGQRTSA